MLLSSVFDTFFAWDEAKEQILSCASPKEASQPTVPPGAFSSAFMRLAEHTHE